MTISLDSIRSGQVLTTTYLKRRIGFFWLLSTLVSVGCHNKPSLNGPEILPAQTAVVAALDSWKSGRREGGMLGSNPVIGIVDTLRTERPLLDYKLVGPLISNEKSRLFAVQLFLDTPRETIAARYVVLGNDPLWVFRQEDLDMTLHWEHKMPSPDSGVNPIPEPVRPPTLNHP